MLPHEQKSCIEEQQNTEKEIKKLLSERLHLQINYGSFADQFYDVFINFLGDVGFYIDLDEQLKKKDIIIVSAGAAHLIPLEAYLKAHKFRSKIRTIQKMRPIDTIIEKNLPYPNEQPLKNTLESMVQNIQKAH